jgi:hypothetical protein
VFEFGRKKTTQQKLKPHMTTLFLSQILVV